ncbi:type 1 glutamine amidotransferase-like domain-containing protein [Candidatus Woesearchaeota archaeon]|nr:type 1 glutamine amidotransferase-like domain-containing protein [Candidatus Woesearchaeota archaeon]
MKLILSGGGSGKDVKELYFAFAKIIDKSKPLLYIPIAIDNLKHPYSECLSWLKENFYKMGIKKYEVVTEDNIRTYAKKNVSNFGGVYIGGGNTPYLLKKLKESGMWKFLKKALKEDIPIYGESAGAVIFSKSIKPALNFDKNWVELNKFNGMNLLNGYFLFCHFEESKEERIREIILKQNLAPSILLRETNGLIIEGKKIRTIGKENVFILDESGNKKLILDQYPLKS